MTAWPSLLICGRRVPPRRLVPALQLSVYARSGVRSKVGLGAGVVLWELLQQLSVSFPEPSELLPRPCLVRAVGRPRRSARGSRGERGGDTFPWALGSWKGFLLGGPAQLFQPPLAQPMTMASSLPFAA